jgi:SNF2 family DNA or RNA helicase
MLTRPAAVLPSFGAGTTANLLWSRHDRESPFMLQIPADSQKLRYAVLDHRPLPPITNAKTTLLISPLSTISNWEEQIQAHVQKGSLTSYLHHGNRRETNSSNNSKNNYLRRLTKGTNTYDDYDNCKTVITAAEHHQVRLGTL